MRLVASKGKIVVEPIKNEDHQSIGGILLPTDEGSSKVNFGIVKSIGCFESDRLSSGDTIVYQKFSGVPVTLKTGETYVVLTEQDILGVVEND